MLLAEVAQEGQRRLVSFGLLFVFEKKNLRPPEFFTRAGEMLIEMLLVLIFKRILQKTVRCFLGNSRQDANGLIFLGQKPLASQQVPCSFLTGSSWSTPCVSDSVNGTSLFKYTVRNKEPLQLQALGFGAKNRKK